MFSELKDLKIIDLTVPGDAEQQAIGAEAPEIDLGDATVTQQVRDLLARTKKPNSRQHFFVLSWQGPRVPRGVQLCGHTIGLTQRGTVFSDGPQDCIGTYDRILDGRTDPFEQCMFICLYEWDEHDK